MRDSERGQELVEKVLTEEFIPYIKEVSYRERNVHREYKVKLRIPKEKADSLFAGNNTVESIQSFLVKKYPLFNSRDTFSQGTYTVQDLNTSFHVTIDYVENYY